MKSLRIKREHLLVALAVFALLLTSCRKSRIDEVKINDFASLSAEFLQPSKEYTTAPFFVWNYKITKEEIDNYMNDFKRLAAKLYIPDRPNHEYLSNDWFELLNTPSTKEMNSA
jgi:hypothetical protein